MAVGHNQWYHFGVGAPPSFVDFSGDWDVDWGYDWIFTHGHIMQGAPSSGTKNRMLEPCKVPQVRVLNPKGSQSNGARLDHGKAA